MILVDTSAWVDFFNNVETPLTDLVARAARTGRIVVGDLVYVEVLQGIRDDKRFDAIGRALSRYRMVSLSELPHATMAAANYRLLRKRGITIRGTIDVIIATWCIANDVPIIHNDRDMAVMERELGLVSFRA